MSRGPVKTSHNAIVRYWEWRDVFDIDACEPSCFACSWSSRRKCHRKWDSGHLERAHLIPDCLGGVDAPENLVLLCKRCHREAPMFDDPSLMIDWIRNRESYLAWIVRTGLDEVRRAEISQEELAHIDPQEMLAWFRRRYASAYHPRGEWEYPSLITQIPSMLRHYIAHRDKKAEQVPLQLVADRRNRIFAEK